MTDLMQFRPGALDRQPARRRRKHGTGGWQAEAGRAEQVREMLAAVPTAAQRLAERSAEPADDEPEAA